LCHKQFLYTITYMSRIEFNEAPIQAKIIKKKTKQSMQQKLVSWGLARTEATARLYLIGFIVVGIGLIIFLNIQTFSSPTVVTETDVWMTE